MCLCEGGWERDRVCFCLQHVVVCCAHFQPGVNSPACHVRPGGGGRERGADIFVCWQILL